jgi:hypothetical protein
MVRKSSAIDGPIFGRSVRTCVFERLVFVGFILVADNGKIQRAAPRKQSTGKTRYRRFAAIFCYPAIKGLEMESFGKNKQYDPVFKPTPRTIRRYEIKIHASCFFRNFPVVSSTP